MERKYIVKGRVQGVGFRWFTRDRAQKIGIRGQVRNLSDGSVEVFAAGNESQLAIFRKFLEEGPPFSRVKELIECQEPLPASMNSFTIK